MEKQERIFEHGGHWLVQRPDTDKYYIARWPRGSGARRIVRVSTGTADLEQAKRRLIEFVNENLNTVQAVVPPPPPAPAIITPPAQLDASCGGEMPLLDMLCDYVDRLASKPCYRKSALPGLKHWSIFLRDNRILYVRELTLDSQERFVTWRRGMIERRKGSASNGTIIKELGLLKAALRDAWKRQKLSAVPYVMSLPGPPARDRFLTVEEVRRLLAECHEPHLRLFVSLALHTLQRPIAILNLQVSQVDLMNRRIDFMPSGAEQTKKRRPVVPITETLLPELRTAISQSLSGYVVEWMGEPIKSVRTAFDKACIRAGLEDVTPYVLRHTGATLLAAAGVPLRQIAGMLGHTTEKTTEIYAKHRPEFLREASDALDRLFGAERSATGAQLVA